MSAKKWFSISISFFLFISISLWSFVFLTDPYGYFSKNNKYIYNLTHIDYPNVIHNKILSKSDIYLLGSSRQMRINPLLVEKSTGKSVQCIAQMTATLDDTIFLAHKIKELDKNFIFSFDAFSLNASRIKSKQELRDRLDIYKKEFENDKDTTQLNTYIKNNIYLSIFNMDILLASLQHNFSRLSGKAYNYNELDENSYDYPLIKSVLKHSFSNLNNPSFVANNFTGLFKNYLSYSDATIIKLAKLATKDDIFVIYPKHAYYYKLFQEYQNVQEQYFHAIKTLVNNTDARVISFYDVNEQTLEDKNFDFFAWHFKPKIGDLIIENIYQKDSKKKIISYELRPDNIDNYLQMISTKVKESFR
ncbi:hypothetical protein ACFLR3_03035 [Campylobacterota bacterium]